MLFLLVGFNANSQDTIALTNGKVIISQNTKIGEKSVRYELIKKNGKVKKPNFLDFSEVFSVKWQDSVETVIYKPHNEIWDYSDFTIEEMRMFIYGQQDAKAYYKAHWWTITSFAVGAGTGYLLYDQIYVAGVPFVLTVGSGVLPANFKDGDEVNPFYKKEEAYQLGYMKAMKNRRVFNTLAGSILGTLAGVSVGYVTE